MPIYKRISVEELQFWLTDLLSLLRRIYAYPNKEIVLYFIVSLYEYIQVATKLRTLGVSDREY